LATNSPNEANGKLKGNKKIRQDKQD